MKRKKLDLGFSFADFIEQRATNLNLSSAKRVDISESWENSPDEASYNDKQVSAWRLVPLYLLLAVIGIFLVASAFRLQVIHGASFLSRSEGNHVLVRVDHAPRGVIYDRSGEVLVRNKPGFRIAVRKVDLPEGWEEEISKVAAKINQEPQSLIAKINQAKTDSVTLTTDLTNDQAIDLKSTVEDLPWLLVEIDPKREYVYGPSVAALLGYTGEVSESDLKDTSTTPYSAGDQIGKVGVEASFEKQLRGANGYSLVKVDSQGKNQGLLFETKPVAGNDITLSVDIELQNFVYTTLNQILADKGGEGAAAVVSDVNTGEILALTSVPTYDNNFFTKPINSQEYQTLINHPGHLLLNRSVASAYPPGSTFKMVVAAAGLETGAINQKTKFLDTGFIKLGDVTFNNWLWLDKGQTEGEIDVVRALARSNDTFFYLLGQLLGEDKIAEFARKFGLGQKSGVEIPGEVAGLVPDAPWKEKTYNQVWYPGETVNYSIGQGYLQVTPIQLNTATAAIANGANLITPTIIHNSPSKKVASNFINSQTLEELRKGMFNNTFGDGNVSYLFNNFPIKTAGKTGTAESGSAEAKPHAWYTAFAPYEKPEIAVTVLVERVGHGSEVAAPAVKKIFEWWFGNRQS